jgi:hypothetical protein
MSPRGGDEKGETPLEWPLLLGTACKYGRWICVKCWVNTRRGPFAMTGKTCAPVVGTSRARHLRHARTPASGMGLRDQQPEQHAMGVTHCDVDVFPPKVHHKSLACHD